MNDLQQRAAMLRVAEEYDRLAERAKARSDTRQGQARGPLSDQI